MSRTATRLVLSLAVLLVLAATVEAESLSAPVRDLASLVYFADRHDRLWSWVQERIDTTEKGLTEESDREALRHVRYDFYLRWGHAQERTGGPDAADLAIATYGRALDAGLPTAESREARERMVTLRLDAADRMLAAGEDLAPARRHVEAVLALPGLESDGRARAEGLQVRIDSREGLRLLDAGEYTKGYDLLDGVVRRYGERRSPEVDALKARLRQVEQETGLLTLRPLEVSETLRGANAAVVGEPLPRPTRATIHVVRLADFTVSEKPIAEMEVPPGAESHVRLKKEEGSTFTLRFGFGGRRPDLEIPFDLRKGDRAIDLPDRIPARMAYVPDGPGGPYFIGLYEVRASDVNEWRQQARRPVPPGRGDEPARQLEKPEIEAFLKFAGVSLPTPEEWTLAALGRDGRPLPWGRGDEKQVRTRAHIQTWGSEVEPVEGRPQGASPYGLRNVLGNVWEIVQGWFAMGGGWETDYALSLLDETTGKPWSPDLLRDPRPLEPAIPGLDARQRGRWRDVLFDEPDQARVNREDFGLRVVLRLRR